MQIENIVKSGDIPATASVPLERRYDVDWLRTIAIGLLIIYHGVISFMPWAWLLQFPQNDISIEWVWIFMGMLNIWRIPILFLVSGMGIRFAMERRDWKQMFIDRTVRILVPYLFGIVVLWYLVAAALPYLGWDANYTITFGHLWFLLNIYLYFSCFIGLFMYLKANPDNGILQFLSKVISWKYGLFLFAIPLMLEAWITAPENYATFVDNAHGWVLGLICFFMGFIFISLGDVFWPAVERIRRASLTISFSLYLVRFLVFKFQGDPIWLTALESLCWMLTILGFGSLYFNKPSRILNYLSKAVYPVYIVHMPVQFVAAYFILPMQLPAFFKMTLLLAGTFAASLLLYELFLRRIKWIRPLFGIKFR